MKNTSYLPALAALVALRFTGVSAAAAPQVTTAPSSACYARTCNPPDIPYTDNTPASNYYHHIEIHSAYVTPDGEGQKWKDPAKTVDVPITMTEIKDGKPTPTVYQGGIKLEEVTKAADGLAVGDWTALLTPDAVKKIEDAIGAVCSLKKRDVIAHPLHKRDSCRTFAANPDTFRDRLWQPVRDVIYRELGIMVTAEQAEAAATLGAATLLITKVLQHYADHIYNGGPSTSVFSWQFPKQKVDDASKTETEEEQNQQKSCPKDKPSCPDPKCKGDKNSKKCTVGEKNDLKNCECLVPIDLPWDNFGYNLDVFKDQQTVLDALANTDPKTEDGPFCVHGASPHSGRLPADYCSCGFDDPNKKTLTYEVAKPTGSVTDPCPYDPKNHPSQTVTFRDPTTTAQPGPTTTAATPITELKEQNLQCANKNTGGDVQPDWVNQYSGWACAGVANKQIGPNDQPMDWRTTTNDVVYHYHLEWIKGCKTTVDKQNVANPLNVKDPGYTLCQESYVKCYTHCTGNGGAGGSLDQGCLRYSFTIS